VKRIGLLTVLTGVAAAWTLGKGDADQGQRTNQIPAHEVERAAFPAVDVHLGRHPDWSFCGPRFPSKRALLDARNRVFARHPETTFIALHVANHPEDLDDAASVLDRYPNVVVETGAREAELGRQPRRAREFFLKYQDRVLFGTDQSPEEGGYRNWFRFFESADGSFDYCNSPRQGRWRISGLDLPKDVLEKVYAPDHPRARQGGPRNVGNYRLALKNASASCRPSAVSWCATS